MEIQSVMKRKVVSVGQDATLQDGIELVVRHGIGLLPVVDPGGVLVGILRLQDILELSLPAFVKMVQDLDFVHDFGAVELGAISQEARETPIRRLMRPPVSVPTNCGLLRAHALMRQHDLPDLPVVDDRGRLVGIASWVDVGAGFLRKSLGR
jgi:CBS domain-containing protein